MTPLAVSLLQKAPIVVDVVKQPPPTPTISYGGILMSAVALVVLILVAAALVGVVVGGIFIFVKNRFNWRGPTDPGHARLRI